MAAVTPPKKIKSVTLSIVSPFICYELMGPDAMILVFWMLSFNPTFSVSSFTLIKRLIRSSSLFAVRVVVSEYLKLLIFLLAILIPACDSSSPWHTLHIGLSRWLSNKESACSAGVSGDKFNPWVWKNPWRKAWQPTPVFLPGESHGQMSLAGYSPWGRKE